MGLPAPAFFHAVRERLAPPSNIGPAADAVAAVAALEERYGVTLPTDFRDYLLHAAPVSEGMDDVGIHWWAIDRILNIPDETGADWMDGDGGDIGAEKDRYLVFADYLIWCWAWAICCLDGPNRGRIAMIGGTADHFIANTFRDFTVLALTDSPALQG